MKKILLMLMPLFVVIALMFYYQNREFSFNAMLEVFSSWRFDNGWELLQSTADTFGNVSTAFEDLSNSDSFFEALKNIGKMISNFFVGIGSLIACIGFYLYDLVLNMGNVLSWLFY